METAWNRPVSREEMMLAFVRAAINVRVTSSHQNKCHFLILQASSSGYISIVQVLLSEAVESDFIGELKADDPLLLPLPCDERSCTPLLFAVLASQADTTCLLLQNGAVTEDAVLNMPSTPLVAECPKFNELWKRRHRCLPIHLEASANLNGVDEDGRTTLSWITCPNQID